MAKKRKVRVKNNKAEDVETKECSLKLSIKDRLILNQLMPKQNDMMGQMVARDILEKVLVGPVESEKINIRANPIGQGLIWDSEKDKGKTTPFSGAEMQFLRTQVTRLDREKAITSEILSLCLKIKEKE